jgi:UDP-N-acetylmuramyl pentapeptide synthase
MSTRNQTALIRAAEALQKMKSEAGPKLAYMKMMKEHAENTASASDDAKNETIKFFDSKIRELEIDAVGSPRYSYNLRYAIDFGREANGVDPEFANKQFASTEEIVHFIEMLILTNDMLYISDTYNIPSPSNIEKMFNPNSRIQFNISIEDDDYPVPPFEVVRTRINY